VRQRGSARKTNAMKDQPLPCFPGEALGVTFIKNADTLYTRGDRRKGAKVAEKMVLCSGRERPPEQKPPPLGGKGFGQTSAGGREAVFYAAASHGRIKESFNPLRSRRRCAEIRYRIYEMAY
jgi:hypothetical protein